MMRIGEFSKRTGLSKKALRIYDGEGLLSPEAVDPDTGYRSYSEGQLMDAARISFMRFLGLSLKEIGQVLGGADARSLFRERAAALQEQADQVAIRLTVFSNALKEDDMKYEVKVYEQSGRRIITDRPAPIKRADGLAADGDAGHWAVADPLPTEHGGEAKEGGSGEGPAGKVLSIALEGRCPDEQIGEASSFLWAYAEANGLRPAEPVDYFFDPVRMDGAAVEEWATVITLRVE